MSMQVRHVSAYLDEDVFEGMEELRRDERRRTRSEWINQAVLEKVEREKGMQPVQRPTKRKAD